MHIDHVVLWVDNPKVSLEFYCDVLGMTPLRVKEYIEGKAPFPSVRLNDESIFDLMDRKMVSPNKKMTGGDAGGHPINHVCLCLDPAGYSSMKTRLNNLGVTLSPGPESSFGAQGLTPHSVYFPDPDGNIIEIRCYD
ncbi:MAG: catechol 2,3-dioxygenase-like lactoylglutathione lyase family enzyme [Planctomycetota bacterium]|jgi:catechol 2,3-dioxygenase-like lactoylglutathione lyase family enzyme